MQIYDESIQVLDVEGLSSFTPYTTIRPRTVSEIEAAIESEDEVSEIGSGLNTRNSSKSDSESEATRGQEDSFGESQDQGFVMQQGKGDEPTYGNGRPVSRRMSSGRKPLSDNDDDFPNDRAPPASQERPRSVRPTQPPQTAEDAEQPDAQETDEEDDDEDDDTNNPTNTSQIEGYYNHRNEDTEAESDALSEESYSEMTFEPEVDVEHLEMFPEMHPPMPMPLLFHPAAIPVYHDHDEESILEIREPPSESETYTVRAFHSDDPDEEDASNFLKETRKHEMALEFERERIRLKFSKSGICRPGYGMYKPEDYEGIAVTPDIQNLFKYITMYSVSKSDTLVEAKLKPFIPEYYPSVGEIDAFLKVIHPEVMDDGLGETVLDEPSAFQSDPSVLDLRLRAMAKQSSARAVVVKKVDNTSKSTKTIETWIKDISDLHLSKPSPSIHYSKPMPDIEQLMQEWPPEFEKTLATSALPPPDLDCDLKTYVDLICNLFDIPVYKSRIQSLHVLAVLYSTHKNYGNYGLMGRGGKSKRGGGDGDKDVDLFTTERLGTTEDGVDYLQLE